MRHHPDIGSSCPTPSSDTYRAWLGLLVSVLACGTATLAAQTAAPAAATVERRDAALDALIAPGAKPELVKGDYFGFVEGPVWVRQGGYLLFSDVASNRIYKLTPSGDLSTFLDKSGFTGADSSTAGMEVNNGRLHVIVLGSNGITIDGEGRVVFCAHGDRAVKRVEKNGTVTVLTDRIDGKRFSGPNDLVYRADGTLYFTDFVGGLRGGAASPLREIPYGGLYMLKGGLPVLLDKDPLGGTPNGLALSPDERTLYLGAGANILKYDVQPDGSLTNRRVLIDMSLEKVPGAADGMKVDTQGNVYTTGPGGVWVVSPGGTHLGTIRIPGVANLAFGGADGRTIYFMARRDIYRLPVKVAGRAPGKKEPLAGAPAVSNPAVSRPVTTEGSGRPFGALPAKDLPPGYVEEERFFSGTATSYARAGEWTTDGRWGVTPSKSAAYTVRMLVRRPREASRFNGIVVMEWLNVSGQSEGAADYSMMEDELIRGGYAWVGVGAQVVGVSGL